MKMDKASDQVDGILGDHVTPDGRLKVTVPGSQMAGVRSAEAFTEAGFTPGMTFEEFSRSVLRFESLTNEPRQPIPAALLIEGLNLLSMACILLDGIKKALYYGKPLDVDRMLTLMQVSATHCAVTLSVMLDPSKVSSRPILGVPNLIPAGAVPNMRALHALLGYCTEAGEIAEALRESLLLDKPLDRVNIDEEFADGDWYKAVWFDVTAQTHGVTLQRVSDKLQARYGDQVYSDANALNRDLATERAILEQRVKTPPPGLNPALGNVLGTGEK
jgi:hypothetical protein